MPERPLILFPTPEIASRSGLGRGGSNFHKPSGTRQWDRLSPRFRELQAQLDARRLEIQQTAAGVDPEMVLVLEIIGSVEKFANAVKRIDGFEWQGEFEVEGILPDDDFYIEEKETKELKGRAYLVMTNQRALEQMLSLWERYKENPDMKKFGYAKFRDVFLRLKDIRRWGTQDRIEETGIIEVWTEEIEREPDKPKKFEIELWFRKTEIKRRQAFREIKSLIEQIGGNSIQESVIPEIEYHALLAEIPANEAERLIENPDIDLVKCESVMFFRPVGQMITGKEVPEGELEENTGDIYEPEGLISNEPIIAIFDGMPMTNHRLLADRVIVDDPDDFASDYTVSDRNHGTAMSSLVIHGDLNDGEQPLNRPVYVRPVLKPIPWYAYPPPEQIPEDELVVDLIHRSVRRLFEREGDEEPVAPAIRVINFSIGDPHRQFTRTMSPLARLLDWLSKKYNVLFIISTGNHRKQISTGIPRADFEAIPNDNLKESAIVKAIYRDLRNRKILSPAESINGIAVGALHFDNARGWNIGNSVNLFQSLLPSPSSGFGSGYRRAIKPDLIFAGGRLLHSEVIGQPQGMSFEPSYRRIAPGNKVASPSRTAGDTNKVAFSCGTSNATALITRKCGFCHDVLVDIFSEQAPDVDLNSYIVPLLKAMITHGCSWGEIGERLYEILRTPNNGQSIRDIVSRWLGYGVPDYEKVMECSQERATLLGFGELNNGEAHLYRLPLPPSLSASNERRRLTTTLAWLSPVLSSNQRYRIAYLWSEVDGSSVTPRPYKEADGHTVRRGTLQHEVFESETAVPIAEDDVLTIKVNCREDAGKILEPVKYGLVVSLEVAEGVGLPIYDEIRTRIAPAVEIRPIV